MPDLCLVWVFRSHRRRVRPLHATEATAAGYSETVVPGSQAGTEEMLSGSATAVLVVQESLVLMARLVRLVRLVPMMARWVQMVPLAATVVLVVPAVQSWAAVVWVVLVVLVAMVVREV